MREHTFRRMVSDQDAFGDGALFAVLFEVRVALLVRDVVELLPGVTSARCDEEVVDSDNGDLLSSPSVFASLFAKASALIANTAPRAVGPVSFPVVFDLCLAGLGGDDGISKYWCLFSSSSRGRRGRPWVPGAFVVFDLVVDALLHRLVGHRLLTRETLTAHSRVIHR